MKLQVYKLGNYLFTYVYKGVSNLCTRPFLAVHSRGFARMDHSKRRVIRTQFPPFSVPKISTSLSRLVDQNFCFLFSQSTNVTYMHHNYFTWVAHSDYSGESFIIQYRTAYTQISHTGVIAIYEYHFQGNTFPIFNS